MPNATTVITATTATTVSTTTPDGLPWWKFGHVWLVLSGPAVVVVASFITLYLAITRPDPVLDENYYQKRLTINQSLADDPKSLAPAMQARNHAQTGVQTPR